MRDLPISLQAVSVVRTKWDKIAEWSEYYDGLTARHTALGSYSREWIEY